MLDLPPKDSKGIYHLGGGVMSEIRTRPATKDYRDGYERTFGKKKEKKAVKGINFSDCDGKCKYCSKKFLCEADND